MQNAQTIYQQAVLPLSDSEKLRLAAIILQNLSGGEENHNRRMIYCKISTVKEFFLRFGKLTGIFKRSVNLGTIKFFASLEGLSRHFAGDLQR